MTSFRSLFFVAVLAGLAAGIVLAGLQFWLTVPLIEAAEGFEAALGPAAPHDHAAGQAGSHDHAGAPHDHGAAAWMPADRLERAGFTLLANLVGAVGFGLVLVAASELAGGIGTLRRGLLWGAAGFTVFALAPMLGLPPELPGMPAGALVPRQVWWLGAALATAAGLAAIVFGRSRGLAAAGLALLLVPHVIGAPVPVEAASPVPPDLHSRFVLSVAATNLVFWMVLGAAVALVRPFFAAPKPDARPRLA